ncbi:hypothetical protein PG994_008124 [Apiospora phragmitis]|uniref:Peptidase S54 rhomboid domain-containing protein n=1 Tax=Apiospora phragmitis TaxID=2905665 RepID=A0ABR1UV82_9PEZI
MCRLTGAWPARRSLEQLGAIEYGRTMRARSLPSRNGLAKDLEHFQSAFIHLHPAHHFFKIRGPSRQHVHDINPAIRAREWDKPSILRFDTEVPVDNEPHVRRRWTWGVVVLNVVVFLGCFGTIREFELNHKRLQLALGQLIDREEYKRLVRSGEVPENKQWRFSENKQWRFFENHMVLSGDCAEQGRWHTLFTHIFLNSDVSALFNSMVMFSVFFRAAWVARFGQVGTPLVAACSGATGGLAFLCLKDSEEERSSHGGASAVVSGLMMAATVARPRMPFFIGFTPAALPSRAVCFVCFLPKLWIWYRDPRKIAEAR